MVCGYILPQIPDGYGSADIWYSDYDAVHKNWLPAKITVILSTRPAMIGRLSLLPITVSYSFPPTGTSRTTAKQFYISVRNQKTNGRCRVIWGQPINTAAKGIYLYPASRDVLYFASQRTDIRMRKANFTIMIHGVCASKLTISRYPNFGGVLWTAHWLANTADGQYFNPILKAHSATP